MKSPQIIAHRGFWETGKVTENSLESLQKAQELAIYGSEFDVRMTQDGVVVVHHDPKMDGISIAETEFQNLLNHQISIGKSLPTLEEFLIQGKENKHLVLVIEIKDLENLKDEVRTTNSVLDLINKHEMWNQIECISFSLEVCKHLKRERNSLKVKYLNGDLNPQTISDLGIDGINYEDRVFQEHPNWISEAKKLGITTGCWTVNNPDMFKELRQKGIDFITTDFPKAFLEN